VRYEVKYEASIDRKDGFRQGLRSIAASNGVPAKVVWRSKSVYVEFEGCPEKEAREPCIMPSRHLPLLPVFQLALL
jgi:hypothetical protein